MLLLKLIHILTSLFVLFAAGAFAYQAIHNSEEAPDRNGNALCSVMMVLALFFMWRQQDECVSIEKISEPIS